MAPQTIVVGGGLAGLSAAHTLLERGKTTLLLEKTKSLGGNAIKASSGINGAGTEAQAQLNIRDSVQAFTNDTTSSASILARPHLISTLTSNSASAVEWLTTKHKIDLSLVSRLGGHSVPRTHRDTRGSPGFAIMSKLMKGLDDKDGVRIVKNARVTRLVQDDSGGVIGVEYTVGEETQSEYGEVILATGGYAADFTPTGLLAQYAPSVLTLPTTNGDYATGDGHRLASTLPRNPAVLCDMNEIQIHPTGFVDPANPDSKTKFLAAEALRGVGGLLINAQGKRFVNEMETREKVSAAMQNVAEVWLVLNEAAAEEVRGHCAFYQAKGLMKKYENAEDLATGTGVPLDTLNTTFNSHSKYARGEEKDPFNKTYFHNPDYSSSQYYLVARMTPVVHYTMGGIIVDASARVLNAEGTPIPGLFAAGEVIGGVHGKNRLGGSSLLEAVVFGRVAGLLAGV